MILLLAFAITLLIAVLFSELSERTVLSGSVIFLIAGFFLGNDWLNVSRFNPDSPVLTRLAEFALFAVLFTDGMRVGCKELASAWRLPGRALLFGMPLTFFGTGVVAHFIAGLDWPRSFLVGAVLSPTDPVFASAIVNRPEIPHRLKHLLNIESGVNDGLALPVVIGFLLYIESTNVNWLRQFQEVAVGVLIGIFLPYVLCRLEESRLFGVARRYENHFVFSIGLLVLALTIVIHANEFLAAFFAGITIATVRPHSPKGFHDFGDRIAELLKVATLLVFGSLISLQFLRNSSWREYVFAFVALVAVRPVALGLALIGTKLDVREKAAALWFGPKGFSSVIYGIMIWKSKIEESNALFHLIALTIVGSMIAHSSTDVLVARWFAKEKPQPAAA
jgi:NhaP-type Na+/H+ or K+/H+ antiporter